MKFEYSVEDNFKRWKWFNIWKVCFY